MIFIGFITNKTSHFFTIGRTLKLNRSLEKAISEDLNHQLSFRYLNRLEPQLEKIENLIIDGKHAKLVLLKSKFGDYSIILIEYSSNYFFEISFHFESNEDNIQIIKAIATSIKFRNPPE